MKFFVYSYDFELQNGIESGRVKTKRKDMFSMVHGEAGVIPRNDTDNAYTVNYDAINTKDYHDKFMGMAKNGIVDEAIYHKAIEFLEHRNGTEFEDIAMISSRTGSPLEQNLKCDIPFRCWIEPEQLNRLISKGERFQIIHNHPGNTLPSVADIRGLYARSLADASTIVAHDGTIYRMEKIKTYDNIERWLDEAIWEAKKEYSGAPDDFIERKTAQAIIRALEKDGYMEYIER